MNVPFLGVKAAYAELANEIDAAVLRVTRSGWYILGEEVEAFESEFAYWCGAKHCIGVGNGLDALAIALRALGVQPGDEVIVPSNTYIATWLAVDMCGGIPVPVEPDAATHCLDPNRVEAAITANTRVVLPVHLYGHPADVKALRNICTKHGIRILEDAAQAHGASFEGRMIGATPDAVAWSFYPGKNLGAIGDAGAVTTDDPDVARAVASIRNYGSERKYINDVKGVNSRLDPVHAAVLRVKLPKVLEWNSRRDALARAYLDAFANLGIGLPSVSAGATHAWHLFVITHPERDRLQTALGELGIGTLIHYPVPPFRQEAYREMAHRAAEWPIAERLANEVLSLPMGPHLSSAQAETVITAVRSAVDFL